MAFPKAPTRLVPRCSTVTITAVEGRIGDFPNLLKFNSRLLVLLDYASCCIFTAENSACSELGNKTGDSEESPAIIDS